MAKLGALQIDVSANVARIQRDLGKINRNVSRSMGKIQKVANTAKQVLGALFAYEVIRRVVNYTKALIDTADQTAKMSRQTGVAIEELSAMGYAAELAGVGTNDLNTGLRRLARNMDDARRGVGEGAEVFSRLGISVTDASGKLRRTEDVLADLADKFKGMADGAEKSAVASILLGRSGAKLIPMLNGGRDGLKAMREEADALGITISAKFARDAEQFNDSLTKMRRILEGIARYAAGPAVTGFVALADVFLKTAKDAGLMSAAFKTNAVFFDLLLGKGEIAETLFSHFGEDAKQVSRLMASIRRLGNTLGEQTKIYEELGEAYKQTPYYTGTGTKTRKDFLINRRFTAADVQMERTKASLERQKQILRDIVAYAEQANRLEQRYAELIGQWKPGTGAVGISIAPQRYRVDFAGELEQYMSDMQVILDYDRDMKEQIKRNTQDLAEDYQQRLNAMQSVMDSWSGAFADSIVRATQTGRYSFSAMVDQMLADMVRLQANRVFSGALNSLFEGILGGSSFFGTQGHPGAPMQHGGIITGPTSIAGGRAHAGEAGVEAVMPLANVGGNLGVHGIAPNVIIQNVDQRSAGADLETQETKGPNGERVITTYIRDAVRNGLRNGDYDGAMSDGFGISRRGARR